MATAKKFKWTPEIVAAVSAAYLAEKERDHASANSDKFLAPIAAEHGAASARAVRSKLSTEGIYEVLDAPKATSTSTRTSKGQIVRSIAKGLDLDLDTISTLDKANADALTALVGKVNEVLAAAEMPAIEIK